MNILIKARGVEVSEVLKEYIERRIGFAVDRFESRLSTVNVSLSDANGPRGGEDKVCQLNAEIEGGGAVLIEEAGFTYTTAVDVASRRLQYALTRRLNRRRKAVEMALSVGEGTAV